MKKIIYHQLPDKCRIIAVSDIHTCWFLLDGILKKVGYKPNIDYLVIIGDILEHGDQNLPTIEYVRRLCRYDRVFCLMGNNDTASYHMAYKYDYNKFMLKRNRKPHNTFLQMAAQIGITEFPENKFDLLRKKVIDAFKPELDFIQSRPYVLETQNHIFIHAGIENRQDWQNTSDTFALTKPFYLRETQCSGKWVVVGHFPCYNYKRACNTNLPIIDKNKQMICIDGGLTIKHACQINAFCITKNGSDYSYNTVWDTSFDKKIVSDSINSEFTPIYCDPYNHNFSLIKIENGLALVSNDSTGQTGLIPQEKLWYENGKLKIWYCLNGFLSVNRGEQVSLCDIHGNYAFIIAQNGQVGWIPNNLIV